MFACLFGLALFNFSWLFIEFFVISEYSLISLLIFNFKYGFFFPDFKTFILFLNIIPFHFAWALINVLKIFGSFVNFETIN